MRITYKNGVYNGDVNYNNDPHGKGEYVWNDGDRYYGDWSYGNRTGNGKYPWPDGGWYEGEYQDGLRHGQGVRVHPDGTRQEGRWEKDEFLGE